MKYIRTKERIIEFKQYDETRNRATELGLTYSEEILKTANTIEELCDEFVYNNELLAPMYISPKESLIESLKNRLDDEFNYKGHKEIFGAIWTYGGLIYVAKMDKEGQFQLWDWWKDNTGVL